MGYDSYKHYNKYPFDNYRIYILQWGGVIFLWYSILTRAVAHNSQCYKNSWQFIRLCDGL